MSVYQGEGMKMLGHSVCSICSSNHVTVHKNYIADWGGIFTDGYRHPAVSLNPVLCAFLLFRLGLADWLIRRNHWHTASENSWTSFIKNHHVGWFCIYYSGSYIAVVIMFFSVSFNLSKSTNVHKYRVAHGSLQHFAGYSAPISGAILIKNFQHSWSTV